MIDWDAILDIAARHVPDRLDPPALYLKEFQSLITAPVQDWTDPFGRGFQYEFILKQEPAEVSLIIELSAVAPIAAVYLCRRTVRPDGSQSDECGDTLEGVSAGDRLKRVSTFLEDHHYDILPYRELNVIRNGKSTYRWLFNDPKE